MFLKVCGITREEDALAAAQAGFDAVGLVFAPSPRQVRPELAKKMIAVFPPRLITVGVFVNEEAREVERTMRFCGLDLAQFHGEEDSASVARFGSRAIKAIRIIPGKEPEDLEAYRDCFAILLDAFHPTLRGGTGILADWKTSARLASRHRVILAGGLTPTLAARAVMAVRPFGLDVSSGVEKERGIKDHAMLHAFVQGARAAAGELSREVEAAR